MSSDDGGRYVLPLLILPFLMLGTLNSGGYRYGASDQAFYLPAVRAKLDPSLFPRDRALITGQARLTTSDDVLAGIVKVTGASLPTVSAVMYVASLVFVAIGTWFVGRSLFQTRWGVAALLAAMTLRHGIARSGTNTLEGYFHPRQLVFGVGLIAVALFLRGRFITAGVLLILGGLLHPSAALWFGVWLGAAWLIHVNRNGRSRLHPALPVVAFVFVAIWAVTAGPLQGHLRAMDDEWLGMLKQKDYIFPLEWPPHAWILNLGSIALAAVIYRARMKAGLVSERERALTTGSCALALVFAAALVLQTFKIALAYQLQPARIFLLFDFLATVYVVWAAAEAPRPSRRRVQLVALAVLALSVARGGYVILQARRPLVQLTIPNDDWGRVMAWGRTTDPSSSWLADPLHAALYGTSVRVAAERDVFVEAVKDAAMGIYDRDVAVRTHERMQLVEHFLSLTTADVAAIGARYGIDYLVAEKPFDFPVVFQSGPLKVYRLR